MEVFINTGIAILVFIVFWLVMSGRLKRKPKEMPIYENPPPIPEKKCQCYMPIESEIKEVCSNCSNNINYRKIK